MDTFKPTRNIWEITTPEQATQILRSAYGLSAISVALQREKNLGGIMIIIERTFGKL